MAHKMSSIMYGWMVSSSEPRQTRIDVDPGPPLDHMSEWVLPETIPDQDIIDHRKAEIASYQEMADEIATPDDYKNVKNGFKIPADLATSINIDERIATIIASYTNPRFHELLMVFYASVGLDEEGDESRYICIDGALFLANLIVCKDWSAIRHENEIIDKCELIPIKTHSELLTLRGVYKIDINVYHEDHSFVIYIKSDQVTILNTYGGYPEFFHVTYSLADYSALMTKFITTDTLADQLDTYHQLWGFRPEMTQTTFDYLFEEIKEYGKDGEESRERFKFVIEHVYRLF